MMSEVVPSQPQKASLLTLPYEIRVQIYELVLYRERPLSSAIRTFLPTIPHIRLLAVVSLSNPVKPQNFSRCIGFYSVPPRLSSIRAVNSQLYYETRDFIHFPKYRVRVIIDDELRGEKLDKVLQVLNYDFVRQNTIEVVFQFAKVRVFSRDWTLVKDNCYIWRSIAESFRNTMRQRSTGDSQAKQMIEILHSYPKLAALNLKTYERDMFEWWKDPVRDLPAFAPLLERGVKIMVEAGKPTTNLWYFARKRLLATFTEGHGEVMLVEQDMRPWVGAPPGAQLFEAELRALVV